MTLQLELQLLQDARALIADEKNWCKETFHKSGGFLRHEQYCLVGALHRVAMIEAGDQLPAPSLVLNAYVDALGRLDFAADRAGRAGAIGFNDAPRTTHGDVLWLLDMAITQCKQDLSRPVLVANPPVFDCSVNDADFRVWTEAGHFVESTDERELVAV